MWSFIQDPFDLMKSKNIVFLVFVCSLCLFCRRQPLEWPRESSLTRPWTYWWWMGSAVEEAELDDQLERLAAAGFGGVHIIPIYGAKGYEDDYIMFAGRLWMHRLAQVTKKAKELDMQVDMTCGTGWPFGGPHLTAEKSASRVVIEPSAVNAGTIFNRQMNGGDREIVKIMAYSDTTAIDLTDKVNDNGVLTWNVPAGNRRIFAVYNQATGQMVKRAAPGSEGPVLDYFSAAALKDYLAPLDTALKDYGGPPVRSLYHDSYEVYGADWTSNFFYQFLDRRGYHLENHLRALNDEGDTDYIARIKYDYRSTIDDLLRQEFTENWVRWAHAKNLQTRNQAHGSPGNLLDLYACADIPETESFGPALLNIPGLDAVPDYPEKSGRPDPLMFKFASSAAHLTGKKLVSAETGTWAGEHFKVSLARIKPHVDQLFCGGINHIFYHGVTYSPRREPWPGWLFYASTNFGPTNTFWRDLPALNRYISRCQAFLQSGQPDHDILLYFPIHDIWSDPQGMLQPLTVHNTGDWLDDTDFYKIAQFLRQQGYTFDYVSDRLLKDIQFSSDGLLTSNGGSYKVVVVPEMTCIPHQTLNKLVRLASAGATVVFHRSVPADVPGFAAHTERKNKLLKSKAEINPVDQSENLAVAELGRGRMWVGDSLELMLGYANVFGESAAKHHLQFTRRKTKDQWIYFVSNPGPSSFRGWLTLNVPAGGGYLFDPLTGSSGAAKWRQDPRGRNQVLLHLAAGESCIFKTTSKYLKARPYAYRQPLEMSYPVESEWQLSFVSGGPALPKDTTIIKLESWANWDSTYRAFSGTVRYRTTVVKPAVPCDGWLLQLGRVAHSAEIWINDEKIATSFCHPFVIDLKNHLGHFENVMDIYVTNLCANRIIDLEKRHQGWKNFYDINFVSIDYTPFNAAGWPYEPSGLLGPVNLVPYHHK